MNHVTARRFETADADPSRVADAVAERATSIEDGFDELVESIADADAVLLGEASHGTSEYYRLRARLTARLLEEHDFSFVAVEGDWTDCYDVTEYVTGRADAAAASEILAGFERWPTWMWANWEAAEFLDWLAGYNAGRAIGDRVGFYGLDVYGLYESMAAVIDALEDLDPELADRARDAYHCFEPYGADAREYARSIRLIPDDCEDEVISVLTELRETIAERHADHDGDDPLAFFAAEQNALVTKNAESFYRTMARGGADSWNVRDRHMSRTLERLLAFHDGPGIVWAHNTHVGDARATSMRDRGQLNLGQLAREEVCDDDSDVAIVGFGSHRGTVIAGTEWGRRWSGCECPKPGRTVTRTSSIGPARTTSSSSSPAGTPRRTSRSATVSPSLAATARSEWFTIRSTRAATTCGRYCPTGTMRSSTSTRRPRSTRSISRAANGRRKRIPGACDPFVCGGPVSCTSGTSDAGAQATSTRSVALLSRLTCDVRFVRVDSDPGGTGRLESFSDRPVYVGPRVSVGEPTANPPGFHRGAVKLLCERRSIERSSQRRYQYSIQSY